MENKTIYYFWLAVNLVLFIYYIMCVYANRFDSVVVLCVSARNRTKKDVNDLYYVLQSDVCVCIH